MLQARTVPATIGRPMAGRPLVMAHFNRGKPFSDEIFGKLRGHVVRLARVVVAQRHAVDHPSRLADDPNPHRSSSSKPPAKRLTSNVSSFQSA